MSAYRLALLALTADAGAIYACLLLIAAELRDRAGPRPGPPALEPWPVTPAVDPWDGEPVTPSGEPLGAVDTWTPLPVPVPLPPAWNRPTSALPRLENRRVLRPHPRNLAPVAAEPPRYVELLLTRRAG